ncbi:helix-turn-helix domain-containing protein [Desulfonatronovibrio hydrogenovorans]|uniref:helix-turn-helix domain-containing protein n=1 Tax=Desulfonatronovibrio hydrogenovorans TaxID=53245 RepID=UPI000491F729|nr:helix-turn-helix domain-containing protein [Desulfonatronovibrio hydrogenovorans]
MSQLDFNRNISRNATNKRVEKNATEIVEKLIKDGFSRADIARHAGVSQTTVSAWQKRGRANADAIDRLIKSINLKQSTTSPVTRSSGDNAELWLHINAIRALGFNVSLKPIE